MRAGLAIDTKTMNTIGAVYHGGFGLGLYADPNAFADSASGLLSFGMFASMVLSLWLMYISAWMGRQFDRHVASGEWAGGTLSRGLQ